MIGSPDPRNLEGIHDCVAFFRTRDEAEAHAIVTRRGVDLVIVCRPWLAWLSPAALPAEMMGEFLVRRSRTLR